MSTERENLEIKE